MELVAAVEGSFIKEIAKAISKQLRCAPAQETAWELSHDGCHTYQFRKLCSISMPLAPFIAHQLYCYVAHTEISNSGVYVSAYIEHSSTGIGTRKQFLKHCAYGRNNRITHK